MPKNTFIDQTLAKLLSEQAETFAKIPKEIRDRYHEKNALAFLRQPGSNCVSGTDDPHIIIIEEDVPDDIERE